ncbi:hypothetical protein [Fortiea sp. LEGE XX443]
MNKYQVTQGEVPKQLRTLAGGRKRTTTVSSKSLTRLTKVEA